MSESQPNAEEGLADALSDVFGQTRALVRQQGMIASGVGAVTARALGVERLRQSPTRLPKDTISATTETMATAPPAL